MKYHLCNQTFKSPHYVFAQKQFDDKSTAADSQVIISLYVKNQQQY